MYSLQIHQEVIYALVIMTPMLAGAISGNMILLIFGIIFYRVMLEVKRRASRLYSEGLEIMSDYRHRYLGGLIRQIYSTDKDHFKKVILIGSIKIEKLCQH